MLNQYAARYAADVLRRFGDGDKVGNQMVAEQLDAISEGRFMMVSSDASEVATEEARRHLASVYCILNRPDPTCVEYRGAIDSAKAYIQSTCKWLKDYL